MRAEASAVEHSLNERVLADAMVDVATELRLADPTEFALMIRGDQEANIADLVNSSSELFFKTGALKYGLAAKFDLGWESTPIVGLDMEFRHEAVTVFFRLMIGAARAGVEIIDVLIENDEPTDAEDSCARLAEAIAGARVS
jgi:hypothetical protein